MTTHITLLCALSGAIYRTGFQAALEGYGCGLLRAPKGEGVFSSHYAIVRKGQDLIVVFRGTDSIRDWMTNIYSGPARVSDNLHAHRGYWAAVSRVMHPLLVSLNNGAVSGQVQHVYFTGHSKGGGEAILAYLWWTTNSAHVANSFPNLRGAKVMVVTFGAPLVVMVDDEARPPRQLDGAVVNYVDHLDIVPKCLARRTTWKIRDYQDSIDLIPTFVSAARSVWLAVTNPAQLINGKLKLETLFRSSQSVRDAIVYTIAFHLERLRGKGPQYVPVGRFVELSPKGAREISAEKLMAKASAPARLSVEGVWEMIMHHYPARYAEGVGRAQN